MGIQSAFYYSTEVQSPKKRLAGVLKVLIKKLEVSSEQCKDVDQIGHKVGFLMMKLRKALYHTDPGERGGSVVEHRLRSERLGV